MKSVHFLVVIWAFSPTHHELCVVLWIDFGVGPDKEPKEKTEEEQGKACCLAGRRSKFTRGLCRSLWTEDKSRKRHECKNWWVRGCEGTNPFMVISRQVFHTQGPSVMVMKIECLAQSQVCVFVKHMIAYSNGSYRCKFPYIKTSILLCMQWPKLTPLLFL